VVPPPLAPPPPEVAPPASVVPRAGAQWQIDGSLSGSVYTLSYAGPTNVDVHGNSASGTLGATRFLTPVVDDGAPRSLQPFLQRTSTVYASVGGSGFVTRNPGSGPNRTDAAFNARAGFDVYVSRYFALFGSFTYGYDVLHDVGTDQATHSFTPSAGFGVRAGDARFNVAYTFSASDTNGAFAPLRWGTLDVSAFVVFERVVRLLLWGRALQGGGMGGGGLEYFPVQDFGIYADGFGGRGQLYISDLAVTRFGGDLGFAAWASPRVRLEAAYTLTRNVYPTQVSQGYSYDLGETRHTLLLASAVRFP
jgi:hypothetical protein